MWAQPLIYLKVLVGVASCGKEQTRGKARSGIQQAHLLEVAQFYMTWSTINTLTLLFRLRWG